MSLLSEYPIAAYKRRYGLQGAVETGTFRGVSTLAALAAGFRPIMTVDVEAFDTDISLPGERESGIYRFIGPSTQHLPRMLDAVKDMRALIFLDAHCNPNLFDGGVEANNLDPLPLHKELEIIFGLRDVSRDVIIIDDMHLNVLVHWQERYASDWGLPKPPFKTVQDLKDLFPGHDGTVHTPSDSALVLLPKAK